MRGDLVGSIDRAAEATATEIGTLHTQIQEVEMRLGAKLDDINGRLNTHAGLLQSGAQQITRFFQFTERSSKNWQALAKRVDALVRKSENGSKS